MTPSTATEDLATAEPTDLNKHCIFRCDQSWFSVPATTVREITVAPDLVAVPNSHPALAGLCHLRSEFIPVLSLTELLNGEDAENTDVASNLLVLRGSSVWAMQIAEAAALQSLETLVTPDVRSDDLSSSPITGTAMFRDQIVRVLDPVCLLRLAQQSLETDWRGTSSMTQQDIEPTRSQR